jgi:chromosome segregation ATPase
MKKLMLLIFIGLMFYSAMIYGQEVYQWVDEKGTAHYTDDPALIPERYQDQVQRRTIPKELVTSPPAQVPSEPQSDIERKDLLGRDEDWWRDKAMGWKQKLTQAQKNYEAAQEALKAKDKELELSIYKPDSFKRRLQAEIKALEEKVNEQKRQVDEAKDMLEKVLPKQAEEYRADPSWVRVE